MRGPVVKVRCSFSRSNGPLRTAVRTVSLEPPARAAPRSRRLTPRTHHDAQAVVLPQWRRSAGQVREGGVTRFRFPRLGLPWVRRGARTPTLRIDGEPTESRWNPWLWTVSTKVDGAERVLTVEEGGKIVQSPAGSELDEDRPGAAVVWRGARCRRSALAHRGSRARCESPRASGPRRQLGDVDVVEHPAGATVAVMQHGPARTRTWI